MKKSDHVFLRNKAAKLAVRLRLHVTPKYTKKIFMFVRVSYFSEKDITVKNPVNVKERSFRDSLDRHYRLLSYFPISHIHYSV